MRGAISARWNERLTQDNMADQEKAAPPMPALGSQVSLPAVILLDGNAFHPSSANRSATMRTGGSMSGSQGPGRVMASARKRGSKGFFTRLLNLLDGGSGISLFQRLPENLRQGRTFVLMHQRKTSRHHHAMVWCSGCATKHVIPPDPQLGLAQPGAWAGCYGTK